MADEASRLILADTAVAAIEEPPRRFFRRRKRKTRQLTHCENCATELSGRYCPQCGQPAIDYRRSFRQLTVDALESFLNWDSKFFATVALLITRPWRLTIAFLSGQRVRYLHPLRLYLLASILFFFAVTYGAKSIKVDPIRLPPELRAEIKADLERENVPPEVRAKIEGVLDAAGMVRTRRAELEAKLERDDLPAEERGKIEEELKREDLPGEARAKVDDAMKDLPPEARAKVQRALKVTAAKGKSEWFTVDDKPARNPFESWIEARAKDKLGEKGTKIQLFVITVISNLPYMMLVCIPLFAFVLKILYIRKGIFYIDHLIYALHIHTFMYLAVMIIVLATMGLNHAVPGALAGWTIGLMWTVFAAQIVLSIRRVYRQGWFFTFFKLFAGGVAYLVVLIVALAATFLITLALP